MIGFHEKGHRYESISEDLQGVEWISATGFVGRFETPFDKNGVADKVSKKKGSKWYGMPPWRIVELWDAENQRSTDIGSMLHAHLERKYLSMETMPLFGKELKVNPPWYDDLGRKIDMLPQMSEGVYPEKLLFKRISETLGVCGQSDVVAICDGKAHISDHKTNKEIKTENHWSKLLPPYSHLDDCEYSKYNLQLSLYMWIVLQNNPELEPGEMLIRHNLFEIEAVDDYGFPVVAIRGGVPVVREVVKYRMKYLREEIESGIEWIVRDYNRKQAALKVNP